MPTGFGMERNRFFLKKNKRLLIILLMTGASSYGVYKLFNLPIVARQRTKFFKLLDAAVAIADLIRDSSKVISIISRDLKEYLTTESDEVPTSLKQVSKLASSPEITGSLVRVSQALTTGILCGFNSNNNNLGPSGDSDPGILNKVMDKMSSDSGTGFMSTVVGSFARNLVSGYVENSKNGLIGALYVDERLKGLILKGVETFVRTGVTVFLEKTMHINTYDELFAGLTNPRHQERVREVVVSVCNNAVETLIKTSHQVLCRDLSSSKSSVVDDGNGKGIIDESRRLTLETMRFFGEYAMFKMCDGLKKSVKGAHEEVLEKGMQVVNYVGAKSYVILTICMALCLHFVGGSRALLSS